MFTSWKKSEKSEGLHFEIGVLKETKTNQTNLNLTFFLQKDRSPVHMK